MRPLVLISGLGPGGAERVTVSCLVRLARQGRAVPLCTVTGPGDGRLAEELAGAGVVRHGLAARRLADPPALLRLLRLLHQGRHDLVHAHGQDATIMAAAACALSRLPLVVTRHALDEWRCGRHPRARVLAARLALRRADAVVAVSAATALALARATRVPRDRVRVIPNGIDLERFGAVPEDTRARTRAALGAEADDALVLFPAVLRDGKGHDVLLSALPQIRALVPRARVLIAGVGPLEAALRARARAMGDAVTFLGHRDDMPALLAAADLVVLPSRSEALPTALIEAAAAGRAVVATHVGGVEEVVVHDHTGVLIPPGNVTALVAAVCTLLLDPARADALGAAARARVGGRFDIDDQARRTWQLWQEFAGHGAHR